MNIYSALYNEFYPFDHLFPNADCIVADPLTELKGPGFLIIWGGEDIHPELYNRPNIASSVGVNPSSRDRLETTLFQKAVRAGLLVVGVCRGAQLGCALSGGILVQDVSNHERDHFIKTEDDDVMRTSSLHHQMMFPWSVDHKLIAWSHTAHSDGYIGVEPEEMNLWPRLNDRHVEPEIVWFPKTKCLAIQGHPEFMEHTDRFNTYTKHLITTYGNL